MKFQPNDIWTRRERDGRTVLWISQDCLVTNLRGVTENKLRTRHRYLFLKTVSGKKRKQQSVLPDTGASWRYATKKGVYYYDLERLPESRQQQLPPADKLVQMYEVSLQRDERGELERELLIQIERKSLRYLPHYKDVTDIQAEHLTRACVVLQYAADYVAGQEPTRDNSYYRTLAEIIKRRQWTYLNKNYRKLKEKIDQVVAGAPVHKVVRLPRRGNSNAQKFDDAQLVSWLMYLRARPENYSGAHIARKVRKMCAIARKPQPSTRWIEAFLADPKTKFLTGAKRHRGGRKGADYRDYLPIAGAVYAGDCWQMDGTRVNFIPHKSTDGKERSLMIIAVRDVHSGDIIGFHLDTKEDRYGYLHALNMAVTETGHLPYELVHDRFPGHNTDEWTLLTQRIQREGVKVTVTSTATGKSHVERCFSTLQDVFMQDTAWYYGQGVQSSREAAHRSPDYLVSAKKRARKEGFDFDMAWKGASAVVAAYRHTALNEYSIKYSDVAEIPRQLYLASETPNVKAVDDFRRVELFGTMRQVTIRNNGLIRMRIHKAEYCFRIPDYEIIANYKQVALYYDLEDLSKVHLFAPGDDMNKTYLGEAVEERAYQYYGPEAEMERIAKAKEARKAIRDQRDAELEELIGEVASEVDHLMAATTSKVTVDAAQTSWLEERTGIWQDRGEEPRLPKEAALVPVDQDDDEDDIELKVLRNY